MKIKLLDVYSPPFEEELTEEEIEAETAADEAWAAPLARQINQALGVLEHGTQHDEKTHGRRGGGGGGSSTDNSGKTKAGGGVTVTRRGPVDEVSEKMFGRRLEDAELVALSGAPDGTDLTVRAEIHKPTGKLYEERPKLMAEETSYSLNLDAEGGVLSGVQERQIRKSSVAAGGEVHMRNKTFFLDEGAPPGIGTKSLVRQTEMARKLGVKKISTYAVGAGRNNPDSFGQADLANGYDTWPKLGFDGPLPRVGSSPSSSGRFLRPEGSKAESVHDLFKEPGGREWWTENGGAIHLTFDLAADSASSKILSAYAKRKGYG